MINYTINCYEMKREILNFSEKISVGVRKPTKKLVMDIEYGLSRDGSCLISNIARGLDEKIKLAYTIDRLCDGLNRLDEDEKEIIWGNYIKKVKKNVSTTSMPIALFDDSDINKEYSKKLEYLDRIVDASSNDKKIVNGYHVCEATILGKNEKQPISVYSEIYSCQSQDFKGKKHYTINSIEAVEKVVGKKFIGIFDRGYDDNRIIDYMSRGERQFVIRLQDKRNLLLKDKKRNVGEIAKTRKGKIIYNALFGGEKVELTISYTRAVLPYNKKEYTLVIVYGLGDNPMKLLTNKKIKDKKDVKKVVRLYLSRWRIEEYFRGKKQEYDFENMRVRTLKSMNNLNMLLTIHLGHMAMLAEKIDTKLLTIKIIDASKSLKRKSIVWLSQIAKGVKEILKYAHQGIKEWQDIKKVEKYKQLQLKL